MISAVVLMLHLRIADASEHCGDKTRHLIMDSCEALSKHLRQQLSPNPLSQAPIVKRENEVDTFYSLQSLPDEGEFNKKKYLKNKK